MWQSQRAQDIIKLVVSIVACQVAGLIGSVFTTPSIPTWYAALQKPAFTPPNWLFAPAWLTLYLLMAIAAFLIWRKGLAQKEVKTALLIFAIQLILNALWSVAFFGLKSPLAGFIVIALLWVAILFTILRFFRLSAVAGALMLPYILWVSFAAALNIAIWQLN
ncbi:MAG: tryptophan-rich sensory protein [Dehalococcoidia bacterium]|nr:MAG: tryptophan-rich sensory protein [Dehalococcoidia bacterium]